MVVGSTGERRKRQIDLVGVAGCLDGSWDFRGREEKDGEFERLKLRGSKDKAERILFPAANAIGSAPFFSAYMWAAHLNFGGKEITSLLIRISRLLRYSSI